MTAKQMVLDVLGQLPDDCTLEEIRHQLYLEDKLDKALVEEQQGIFLSTQDVLREVKQFRTQWQPEE